MPKFSANISVLFKEYSFMKRFEKAAAHGFKAVEIQFPYSIEKEQILEKLESNKLELILHNLPSGKNITDKGIACHPSRINEFQESVFKAIEYAKYLKCTQLNCLSGIREVNTSKKISLETLISNLQFATHELEKEKIKLLIEPINYFDMPGFFLNTTEEGKAIIQSVKSKNLFLQYDIYHMQIMEGNIIQTIKSNLNLIQHIQFADNPGRNEPGTGELNFQYIFNQLDQMGYHGWVGAEYNPSVNTAKSLNWFEMIN
ncbi:MAG: hydroxypyruvate isomerase family protein [SAR202 cluster bacterium]|nr:hydroxypyruvate isomerase family protein [SAR202 cluster bacterium]|tara:strand:+ start:55062 stop:55835 length:774 start_codon:yes stop_codon:yes gene_type:complete